MRKTFIITFEAPRESDLSTFYQELKSYGSWARITEHTWAITTEDNAKDVRDYLIRFLPNNGRIFLIKSGSVAAWKNVICSAEWLKKNL